MNRDHNTMKQNASVQAWSGTSLSHVLGSLIFPNQVSHAPPDLSKLKRMLHIASKAIVKYLWNYYNFKLVSDDICPCYHCNKVSKGPDFNNLQSNYTTKY